MEPIKPEKDDVDLYRTQKKRSVNGQNTGNLPVAPTVPIQNTVSLSRSGQWALILLFILVVSLVGWGYWQVEQQRATISTLENQLDQANVYISQSKLIVARLEGQINQTDATMAQSGNELARELKFLDSEVRKLWDVANKRNKEWIQSNQQSLKTVSAEIDAANAATDEMLVSMAGMNRSLAQLSKFSNDLEGKIAGLSTDMEQELGLIRSQNTDALEEQRQQLNQDIVALQNASAELTATQDVISEQLVSSLADMEKKFASHQKSVKTLAAASSRRSVDAGMVQRLVALEASVNGLDKVRRQLVQRIVQLDTRINEMQLELNALQSATRVSSKDN